MKRICLTIAFTTMMAIFAVASLDWSVAVGQQDGTAAESQAVQELSDDEKAVKKAALDYAMSWYTGDPERMKQALHPDLVKRTIQTDGGESDFDEMTAGRLVEIVAGGYGKNTPEDQRKAEISLLDVDGNIASVKLEMLQWTDYLQVANVGGRWVIVNVLWEPRHGEGE